MREIVRACTVAFVLFFAGCSKNADTIVDPGNGGGNGGNNGGGTVTPEQRRAAVDSIVGFAASLTGSPVQDNAQIVQFARGISVIEAAGVEAGNAWARFKDGKLLLIGGFRPTVEGDAPLSSAVSASPKASAVPFVSNVVTGVPDMPTTNQIRILNSLGAAFDPIAFGDGFSSTAQELKGWFTSDVGGYFMPGTDRAEVNDLKGAWGDGVFYMSAHGAKGRLRDGSGLYGIWTSTPVTPTNDILYASDLDSGYLCIYAAVHDRLPVPIPGRGQWATHYAITPKFVRKYMSFAPNSFVFINACLSDDADFKQACIDKGASLYAGWSNYADPTSALNAARYLYDRLLGVNKATPKENPPQRPFEWGIYYTDMITKGFDKASTAEFGLCELKMTQTQGNFSILAPSIVAANAFQMEREIHIGGRFGSDPGLAAEILLGGRTLRIKSWRHDNIICEAPMQGPGSTGDLQVKIRGRKSNVFQISEWRGEFNYVLTGRGTQRVEVTLQLNFRSSLNKYRLEAGKAPIIGSLRPATLLESSGVTYHASGSYTSPGGSTETWSGGGSVPLLASPTQQVGFGMPGSFIDLATGHADLNFGLSGVTYTSTVNNLIFDMPLTIVMTGLRFQIDSQNRIVGGSHTVPLGNYSATLTWPTISPLHPPTADYAR